MPDELDISLEDGKYRVVMRPDGLQAFRHGRAWRNLAGDGLVLALAQEVGRLRTEKAILLDACEHAMEVFEAYRDETKSDTAALNALASAVAKAKGGAS